LPTGQNFQCKVCTSELVSKWMNITHDGKRLLHVWFSTLNDEHCLFTTYRRCLRERSQSEHSNETHLRKWMMYTCRCLSVLWLLAVIEPMTQLSWTLSVVRSKFHARDVSWLAYAPVFMRFDITNWLNGSRRGSVRCRKKNT